MNNPNFNYPRQSEGVNPNQININMQNQNILPPPNLIIRPNQPSRFQILVKQHQLNPLVASQLHQVLSTCKIVLLCDDSGSMNQSIAQQGTDPFAIKKSTRWLQLKKLAASLIQYCSAINQDGLDIHFFNRASLLGVKNVNGLAQAFFQNPSGGTPLCGALRRLFSDYSAITDRQMPLLIIVITDGQPSDGSRNDLYNVLMSKNRYVHISFAQCTDNQQDMQYLDQWDGKIPNFDNTDDYRQQLVRVKNTQGQNFKFDYNDYVVKILLATFVRWYFNLDQTQVQDYRVQQGNQPQGNQPAYYAQNNGGNNVVPMNINSNNNGPDQCCMMCQIM